MLKLKQNKNGKYYLSLVGKNGKKLMTSEDYAKKGNAERAIDDIHLTMKDYFKSLGYSFRILPVDEYGSAKRAAK